ncbi:Serine/threonine-protein kinase OSR1 [Hondaea fermentalgiana]|uniref:Serine/threonine-protein kinase OSR1 n=1 Tax=Hondaea fermentalgiana TaxID=2315210 RepID=A0A2R5GQ20_9STRA|nr:Serine/threonine-protein kinase OSR1 [Hondaea fermentalgiana]|eukprot:GBG32950.1 Serine/threonine-protein kinase OSR1 [Hondaea fermentalgiana]
MNEIKDLISRRGTGVSARGLQTGDGVAGAGADDDLDWPQTASSYELKAQIGQGAFAKVWQATCKERNTDVAIKVIELDNLTSSLDDIYQEVRVMLLSKFPSVLRAYACFVVKRSLWLVMPLMRKGSCLRIMKVLKRKGLGDGLKEEWIAPILKSALEGLEYFHKRGKVHRDIKASNLLMDSDGSVRISDFGVAGWLPNGLDRNSVERRTFVGTPCWMAPEVMEQTDAYDEKADIWSFGITALELAKGYAPYARLAPMRVLLATIQNPPPSLRSYDDWQQTKNKFSRHFREIITLCLQRNPANRPSASTLLSKTFFRRAPPSNFLAKDLLEAVPIPDTWEQSTSSSEERAEQKRQLELMKKDQEEELERQRKAAIQQEQQQAEAPAQTPAQPPAANQQTQQPGGGAADAAQQSNPESASQSAQQQGVAPNGSASSSAPPAAASSAEPGSAGAGAAGDVTDAANSTDPKLQAIANLEKLEAKQGSSFVRGATWVFEDDDADAAPAASGTAQDGAAQPTASAEGGEKVDVSDEFNDFAMEYQKGQIRGEQD